MRLLLTLLVLAATAATAQPEGGAAPLGGASVAPGLSDGATASLLTMVPGHEVYSLFGHSAIRIHDPAAGLDRTYNYGTFDFEQPFFLVRFARGRLNYRLDTAPFADEVARYQWLGRPMIEQTLALDAPTVRALYDALETNALPENREYRYDFLFDNCSTRLLAVVDTALARTGRPPVALAPPAERRTFREHLAPYLVGTPLVELGIGVVLGLPTDRVPTTRQATFLPLDLADAFDRASVGGRPLVARRDTLFTYPGGGMPARAPRWPLWIAWGVAALAVALGLRDLRRGPAPTAAARVLDAVLFGVVGLVGLLLLLFWVATEHAVTHPNWNLTWAWPTHVAAAVALARRAAPRWLPAYLGVAAAVALLMAFATLSGAWIQALPPEAAPVSLALVARSLARLRPARRPALAAVAATP